MKPDPQQIKGLVWLLLTVALGVLFAVGLAPMVGLIPWPVEKAAGRLLSPPSNACEDRNPEAAAAFHALVQRLYPVYPTDASFPVHIAVVHNPAVNAYATLGGQIYVFSGLLRQAESPDEVAGVLAHEMEHVRQRHILQGVVVRLLTIQGLKLIFSGGGLGPELTRIALDLNFSRQEEQEADEGGLKRLRDAQINVDGYGRLFARLAKESSLPALLSDHPTHEDRASLAARYRGGPVKPLLKAEEWRQVKGLCQ